MMLLYVQQNQWLVITLLSGAALTLIFCLTYSAMWRPRGGEEGGETKVKNARSPLKSLLSIVPWVLILFAMTCACFTILTLVAKSCKPPNW